MTIRSQTWKYVGSLLSAGVMMLAMTPFARAGDGVIEINQAKAEAGGVTPGDTEGFPVMIDQPGSYRLTGNLTVPDKDTTAILISSDHVTVDLNGFSILGPNTCTATPATPTVVSCSASGTGSGVTALPGFAPENIAVFNGTVRGMGACGVCFIFGRVERVRAISNGGSGIEIPVGAAVDGPSTGSIITGNWAVRNGVYGINAAERATVTGNTASFNGNIGIATAENSVVSGNTANNNAAEGISASGTISNNSASRNGGAGIQGSGTVRGNTVGNNGGFGLDLFGGGYGENVMDSNAMGTVNGGVEIGINACNGTTTCP